MLIQFTIENHRSIRDSAVISFAASKDTSLASCLIHPDEEKKYYFRSLPCTVQMLPERAMYFMRS